MFCADCEYPIVEGTHCVYCAEHPFKIKDTCAGCKDYIPRQTLRRFKLYGNYCNTCEEKCGGIVFVEQEIIAVFRSF